MPMKNPPHPSGFVLRQCIEPLGLTITQAAAALGVTRTTLSELVHEKRGISPRKGSASLQSLRRQRGHLAYPAGPLRSCPSPCRPHQAQAPGIRVTLPHSLLYPLQVGIPTGASVLKGRGSEVDGPAAPDKQVIQRQPQISPKAAS